MSRLLSVLVATLVSLAGLSVPAAAAPSVPPPVSEPIMVIDTIDGHDHGTVDLDPLDLDAPPPSAISEDPDGAPVAFSAMAPGVVPVGENMYIHTVGAVPPEVINVATSALWAWHGVIERNGAPLDVRLSYESFGQSTMLAMAGPYTTTVNGVAIPTALANARVGFDQFRAADLPDWHWDMVVRVNSDRSWDYSTDPHAPANGHYSLHTVMLHEIGHGLGMVTMHRDTGTTSAPFTSWDHTLHHGRNLPLAASNSGPLRTGADVWSRNIDGSWERAHAPAAYAPGSSLSHLDESTYGPGQAGSLMTPALGLHERIHTIDNVTAGAIAAVGWEIKRPPTPVQIVSATATSAGVTITVGPSVAVDDLPARYVHLRVLDHQGNTVAVGDIDSAKFNQPVTVAASLGPGTYRVEAFGYNTKNTPSRWPGALVSRSVEVVGGATPAVPPTTAPPNTAPPTGPPAPRETVPPTTMPPTGGPSDGAPPPAGPAGEAPPSPTDLGMSRRSDTVDQVARLYAAYFLRPPDGDGLAFWVRERAAGAALEQISAAFAQSEEFRQRYGDLDDDAFVSLVYANVLERPAEIEGHQFWSSQLRLGVSRGQVMVGFSESTEFIAKTGTTRALPADEAKVWRVYQAVFGRDADADGLAFWTGQLARIGLTGVADQFVGSDEFRLRYGPLDDAEFVELVYHHVLGRGADAGGQRFWSAQLMSGASRSNVIIGFSESTEFILKTGTTP